MQVWDTMPNAAGGVPPSADSLAASGFIGSASVAVSVDRSSARSNTAPIGGNHERCATAPDLLYGIPENSSQQIHIYFFLI